MSAYIRRRRRTKKKKKEKKEEKKKRTRRKFIINWVCLCVVCQVLLAKE